MQAVVHERGWSFWLLGLPVAIGAGIVYFPLETALMAVIGLLGVGAYVVALRKPSVLVIEVPISLLILSTFVLRVRDHQALAENPLDPAGLYRVIAVGLAGLTSLIALLYGHRRRIPGSFKLYGLYVLGVFIAVPLSINLALTAYRGIELLTGVVAFLAIWRLYEAEGVRRAGRVLFAFLVVSLAVAWIEVILVPGAVQQIPGSAIPYRIGGYFPVVSADDVGFYGVLLLLWCLARLTDEPGAHPLRFRLLALVGLGSLIGAQYRTGYVCAVVGLLALGLIRRSYKLAGTLVTLVCLVLLIRPEVMTLTENVGAVWRRGEPVGMVSPTLAGRTVWWDAAIPVWQESPIFGKGLLTATRFEVLAPMGEIPSTIHNAWVEALVGTGLLGVVLLGLSLLVLLKRSWRNAWSLRQSIPFVLLSALLVRTLTGSSFEIFGYGSLLYVLLSFTALDSRSRSVFLVGPVRPNRPVKSSVEPL